MIDKIAEIPSRFLHSYYLPVLDVYKRQDEDKTDSAALLPCIEQAREDIHTLRQLQLLHQNR